jgi:serine-type D-Ala-D-Ala carboxypeptidase (penicillin-binding protein 5/6)
MMASITRKALFFLVLFVFASVSLAAALEDGPRPRVPARSYIVILPRNNGTVLWSRDPDKRLPEASLTKIMTAVLVLKTSRLDAVETVSRSAAHETGSKIHIHTGDQFYVRDLLSAMLVKSANDACHALAEHVGGTEANFVALMNREAEAMGLKNTHFTNACGHDDPDHYTTARDLATLTDAALKYPEFARLVATELTQMSPLNRRRVFRLHNSNRLVGRYSDVVGVKTGFTPTAGRCLIVRALRDSREVLLVLLDDRRRFADAPKIINQAFRRAAELDATRAPAPAPAVAPATAAMNTIQNNQGARD